jgi:hypothetical protein
MCLGIVLIASSLGVMAYWMNGNLNTADANGVFMLAAPAFLGGGQVLLSALGLSFGSSGGSTDSSFSDLFSRTDGDSGD